MKTYLLLILLISSTLRSQTNFSQTTGNQIDYFKSHHGDLKDENNNFIFDSPYPDTLIATGETTDSYFGFSVSSAGDVNGDGYSDVIIGAYRYNSNTGRAYIYYGGTSMDNIADVTMTGELQNNRFGISVSSAGDVNGDGYSDVIVGVPHNEGYSQGKTYIYFGGIVMDNIVDIVLTGEGLYNDFGYSVSTAGDVNGDGYSDVICGAEGFDNNRGRAYVFYGGLSMDNVADVTMTHDAQTIHFGISVSCAGDVNGDGYSDVIVGAYEFSSDSSRAYIYYGGTSMDNTSDVIMTNESGSLNFSVSVSTAGDVNGDGYSDVIVGVFYGYNSKGGRAYIYYGGLTMNNESDLIISGETTHDQFGYSVSTAGDVNRDGYSDVIIGANGYYYTTGRAYLYYGGVNMNNTADVIITGESQNNRFGISVSSVGDVNGDGFSDLIVGANEYSNNRGRAYIYITNPDIIKINMKILMEGMYFPIFNQMTRRDTIKVFLRNAISPYVIIDSAKNVIDSLSFSGLFKFINAPIGTYYIVAKHFNSIETWSKVGGEALNNDGSIYNYDFTTSASKAYGNNLKLKGGKYCIYSGDVIQDGFIDVSDFIAVENDAYNLLSGRFLPTDLNGDNLVDLSDMTFVDNNSYNYIGVIRP